MTTSRRALAIYSHRPHKVPGGHIEAFKLLVKRGAKVCTTLNGATPLMEAVGKGKGDMVEYLTKMATTLDLDLNHRDRDGANVLFYCAAGGHLNLLKFLLNAGCAVIEDSHGRNLLMQAALSGHSHVVHFLVKHATDVGIELQHKDKGGRNVLFYSVEGDHLEILQFLLQCSISPCLDNNNRTILMQASRVGSYSIVVYLLHLHNDLHLDLDNNCNVKDINGENAFFYAVRSRNLKIVNLLLEKEIEISSNKFGVSVLSQSMSEGDDDIVEAILSSDVDISKAVNGNDTKGRSIFHHCVVRGDSSMLAKLSRYYDSTEDGDHEGVTCLMKACQLSDMAIIKYLVEVMKVDTNKSDLKNRNALFYAVESSNTQAVSYLLENIDNLGSDSDGKSVLMVAIQSGNLILTDSLIKSKFGKVLLECRDNKKENCVHYAAKLGRDATLALLHSHNCELDLPSQDGVTPLMYACANGHYATASFLLKHGVVVDSMDCHKRSALHYCFGDNPSLKCVKVLMSFDADPNDADDADVTPLMLACRECSETNIAIITYMLDHGGEPVYQDSEGRDAFDYCPFNAEYVKAMLRSKGEMAESERSTLSDFHPELTSDLDMNSLLRGLLKHKIFTKTLNFEVVKRPAGERFGKLVELLATRGATAFRLLCRVIKEEGELELSYRMLKAAYRKNLEFYV